MSSVLLISDTPQPVFHSPTVSSHTPPRPSIPCPSAANPPNLTNPYISKNVSRSPVAPRPKVELFHARQQDWPKLHQGARKSRQVKLEGIGMKGGYGLVGRWN
jgi:hypothetical protein